MPVEDTTDFLVLVYVPEGAVVSWVNLHSGVVAPTLSRIRGGCLRPGACHDARFRLQRARGVAGHAAGKANRGMDAAAGRAVTEADIPVLVFGHAGHPAIGRIRSKGSLLVQSDSASWIEDFVPADRHRAAIVNGVAEHRPIVISKVPDRKAIHHPVAERV